MMGEENVLAGGIDALTTMKENLLELDGYQQKCITLSADEERFEKAIASKEKLVSDEIAITVKKRQDEIEFSFDQQIDKTRVRLKKVKAKRDKYKTIKVSERMAMETASLAEEKRRLIQEIKSVFKINQISRIFNTRMFFSLFLPNTISDFLTMFLAVIFILLLPFAAYKIFLPAEAETVFRLVIFYLVAFLIFFGSYFLLHKFVKEKHIISLKEVKDLRVKLALNHRATIKVKRAIARDKDESSYGLEKFDNEMLALDAEISNIAHEKKEALTTFESDTKHAITNEINSRYQDEINTLKKNYDLTYDERRKAEEHVKDFTLEISRKYEAYLGKDVITIPMIDSLSEIINDGNATTIAEALKYYNSRIDHALKLDKE